MISARSVIRLAASQTRSARHLHIPKRHQIRLQSTSSSASKSPSSAFGAGILGGFAGATIFYGIYSFTPAGQAANKLNKAVVEAQKKFQEAARHLQANTPSSDEAIDSIRQFAYSYVGWIPGGRAYVDAAFDDWDAIRKNHREEADKLVSDAYEQFQHVSKSGLSLETASRAYQVLADLSTKVASLGGDVVSDLLDNHPQIKEKLGGNIDQLKQMGEQYGPEAKKQVDETWNQVKDLFTEGFSVANLDKARKLIEDKVKQIQKLGDEAWSKGLEEIKPYLDKSPKVKELMEKNADLLKQGSNVAELFSRARSAVESGDAGDLESYVNDAVEKIGSKGSEIASGGLGGFDKYLNKDMLSKLQQLGQVADKHREEGEKLLNETLEEVKKVLEQKAERSREIVDAAKKEAK